MLIDEVLSPHLEFVSGSLLEGIQHDNLDLFVSALGYEPRCTHAPSVLMPNPNVTLAIAFTDRKTKAYEEAHRAYSSMGVEPVSASDQQVAALVRDRLHSLPDDGHARIAVDISSLSRLRTALVLEEIYEHAAMHHMTLQLLYSPAAFTSPSAPVSPLAILEPVTPSYSGAMADPELPIVALVGVGYEEQRGLGVIEFLEASKAWVLVPHGFDSSFDQEVELANSVLLTRMEDRRINYDPADPGKLFRAVQSMAHSLRTEYRVIMVPMGPKILSACCMMVSLMSDDVDAVWRASSGQGEGAKAVEAAGPVVGLRFVSRRAYQDRDVT